MKRSWQREDLKEVGPTLHTDKNFIRNWFVVFKLGYSGKKMGVDDILFLKNHWNFRVCYFTLGNSGQNKALSLEILQNCMTPLGYETKIFVIFSCLSLKVLVISYLAQGNSTCYFFNISGKSISLNSQFRDFFWTDKLLIMRY